MNLNLGENKRRVLLVGAAVVVLVVGVVGLLSLDRIREVFDDDSRPDRDADVDAGSPVEQPETDDSVATSTSSVDVPPLADVSLTTTEIGQFDAPISIVNRADDTALYVVERGGVVRRVAVDGEGANRMYTPDAEPLLDISEQVTLEGERGLLDIAFSPDGSRLYVSYSSSAEVPEGQNKVLSYAFDGDPVDESTRRDILTVRDFAGNHNGGDLEFGLDGYLYVGLGDGGRGGDPEGNGQDTSQLLGKVLRIDPEGAGDEAPYAVPADNPFADGDGGEPEIWLYGVRNPWRFSFDRQTGDLWLADVGQDTWEEIDFLPAAQGAGRGANLGWNEMEGAHPFEGGTNPPDGVLPIFEYPNGDGGCSVTGGVVYRGPSHPDLTGAYLFGDLCTSRLRAIRLLGGGQIDERTFDTTVDSLVSFGQDNQGDVYAVSLQGPIYRLDP